MILRTAVAFVAFVLGAGLVSAQTGQGRLIRIGDTKVVKIAYRFDSNPFSFVDDQGEPAGYTIDLCRLVAKSLARQLGLEQLEIQWVRVDVTNRLAAVADGSADMECGSTTVTLRRMMEVDFSSIVFVESTGLLVKARAGISRVGDLAGRKIAVIAGTTNERAVTDQLQRRQISATVVPVRDREEGIAALEEGRVDAFASDKLLLAGARVKDPHALAMLPDDLSFEPYAITLPRGDWAMRLAVNSALADIYRRGDNLKIFDRWFSAMGLRPSLLLGAAFALGTLPE
ncbi:MAG TPA: amino acid ABC transporter substrate-binding protein [Xanthobacteraceae bacterium]|nr:amino acid ABC transporter substrate-binding protein [Xanthobacteraceae bacterium]